MGEKTVWKKELMVETIHVMPRTLEIATENMKAGTVNTEIYVVYGKDPEDRKVWVATFVDVDEAQCFVQSSKTFGRPVIGAVMAGQEVKAEKGAEMSDGAVEAPGSDSGVAN